MQDTSPLFAQGVELMLAGIGSVFVFLVMLVFATRLMTWLITARRDTPSAEVPEAHLAAISIAIERYRKGGSGSK